MKLIIAGGRNYNLTQDDIDFLNAIDGITEVVCGGARGADQAGKDWAKSKGLKTIVFPAHWHLYGKYAGPFRNSEMAKYADAVVLFSGGKGTESMYQEALKHNLKIYDLRNPLDNYDPFL